MQTKAKESSSPFTHEIVHQIVDGDGFISRCQLTGKLTEFRLLGIDAPEIKLCSKVRQDEKETHIAAGLLIKLGQESRIHLESLMPIGSKVIIKQEYPNLVDVYGRQLAYVYVVEEPRKQEQVSIQKKPQIRGKKKSAKQTETVQKKEKLSINEQMVLDGYAKPYTKTYCELLPQIQELYFDARKKRSGHFKILTSFLGTMPPYMPPITKKAL